ncbi:MAG: HAD-IB family hydrolase [Stenotrophobium sp.]
MNVPPSLIEAIQSSPKGSHIGAFFDFDGTIIDGFSAGAFFRDKLRKREMSAQEVAQALLISLRNDVGEAEFTEFVRGAMRSWAGRDESDLHQLGRRLFLDEVARHLFPEAWQLVQAHRRQGHTVAIASSATQFQVEPMAQELGLEHVLCTHAQVENGLLTGDIDGRVLWGTGKAAAVKEFAKTRGIDLAQSYGYANGDEDAFFLDTVGHPCAVNPRSELARIARERGWPVHHFAPRKRGQLGARLRSIASYTAMAGAFAAGLGAEYLGGGGGTREAAELIGVIGSELGLATAGIRLRVQGEVNLWSQRPAVFIFNHQSGLDMLICAKLLRHGITGVAKKEAAKVPGFGQFMRMADMAFIDRGNTGQAKSALAPAVEKLRAGTSLAIAPEGTRSPTPRLGPFKKGAFHIARQAGVPIVPIVIRNAGELLPRGTWVMRPGQVDVAILPPVSVKEWTLTTMENDIESIRQEFIRTLENWPVDGAATIAAAAGGAVA